MRTEFDTRDAFPRRRFVSFSGGLYPHLARWGLPLPELVMSSAGPIQAGRTVKECLATLDDAAYGAATDVLPGKAAVAADAFGLCP